ncbi:hypothetical protein [Kutzneria sp. 744]|uniref:hypothetical protein n=1 Tax=Kutzneria sp. (strain 744) TaxID=345341 RepID=UPI0003EEB605|nr:hypothetical protein [Kutzneria sp. 744]EWM12274.1 hypothetical protein KUTG_02578 [Kutzneria sp. 744]
MRLTLFAVVLGAAVLTTGCSALLPPQPAPCLQERSNLDGAKSMKDLADSEELDTAEKAINAQTEALNVRSALTHASMERATAAFNGADDATMARIDKEIADATAKAATADAAVKAAEADDTPVKGFVDTRTKQLADAQDKLDKCRQEHP